MQAGVAMRQVNRVARDRYRRLSREDASVLHCAVGIVAGLVGMCAPVFVLPVAAYPADVAISTVGLLVAVFSLVRLVAQVLRVTGSAR